MIEEVVDVEVGGRHGDVGCRRSLTGCSSAMTEVKEKSGKERRFVVDDGED